MSRRRSGWAQVVDAWERSGASQSKFASRRGMPLATLQSWIYRRRRERSSARLVEVRVASPVVHVAAAEIALPSGLTIRFAVGTEPSWAAALVKAIVA